MGQVLGPRGPTGSAELDQVGQLVGSPGPTRRSQLAHAGQVLGLFGPMKRLDWGTLALLLATLGLRGNISRDLEAVE